MIRRLVQIGAILALAAVGSGSSCSDTTAPVSPSSSNVDTRPCTIYPDPNWIDLAANVNITFLNQATCPTTMQPDAFGISFDVKVTVPGENVGSITPPYVNASIISVIKTPYWSFYGYPTTMNEVDGEYQAEMSGFGNFSNSAYVVSGKIKDSVAVAVQNYEAPPFDVDSAYAFQLFPGNITSGVHTLIGPTVLAAQLDTNWLMRTDWNSSGYTFQWYVDGSDGGTNYWLNTSFSTLGSHSIVSIATRTDGSADTVTTSITVPFTVALSGPSSIDQYDNGTWTTSIPAGTAPYSYSWYVDDNDAGSSSSSLTSSISSSGGTHRLEVDVSDAAGHFAFAQMDVFVNAAGCDPGEISCNKLPTKGLKLPSGASTAKTAKPQNPPRKAP